MEKKKVMSIVGARPQFIKAATLSKELRKSFNEVLVHTGQHYDIEMSDVFFKELSIPKPGYNLGIGSGSHGVQTGKMLIELEAVMQKERPDMVIVYGDTNSTLAGALAAIKLKIPIAHVEAGLRSFEKTLPEEVNRVLTDHCSSLLFCPTAASVKSLSDEGIKEGVHLVGDIMYDSVRAFIGSGKNEEFLVKLGVEKKGYVLVTLHRAENTDSKERIISIFEALAKSGAKIVLPMHPRTKRCIQEYGISDLIRSENLLIIPPVSYLEMLSLEHNAKKIVTDSGGVQKEAYWLGVPCITLRKVSEWVETVQDGWNVLVDADGLKIVSSIHDFEPKSERKHLPVEGSQRRIVKLIGEFLLKNVR